MQGPIRRPLSPESPNCSRPQAARQEAEDARVVPAESVKALRRRASSASSSRNPAGGLEADPVTFFTAVRLIASRLRVDRLGRLVVGVHPWQLALFPAEAQDDVWGADPATRMPRPTPPTGRARLTGQGYTLDGRWSFSSAATHASWVLLGGIVNRRRGQAHRFLHFPAAGQRLHTIDDVWDTVGLRGTGSNDIIVDHAPSSRRTGR